MLEGYFGYFGLKGILVVFLSKGKLVIPRVNYFSSVLSRDSYFYYVTSKWGNYLRTNNYSLFFIC